MFSKKYRCYSVSMLPGHDRNDVENGGKIIMPASALKRLTKLDVEYPMLFRITNQESNKITHSGVLEFVANEGNIYVPNWMMRHLLLEEGGKVLVQNVSLPVATFTRIQPQNVEYSAITNQKAVLEYSLRKFACLTTGDVIDIEYNDKIYELCVLETKPENAVMIIECDMNVDFEVPVGYQEQEPEKQSKDEPVQQSKNEPVQEENHFKYPDDSFYAFKGEGIQLNGKKRKLEDDDPGEPPKKMKKTHVRGIPDFDHDVKLLIFDRTVQPRNKKSDKPESEQNEFKMFQGDGKRLSD